jgi:hypothetical protein
MSRSRLRDGDTFAVMPALVAGIHVDGPQSVLGDGGAGA